MRLLFCIATLCAAILMPAASLPAQSVYYVSIDTSGVQGSGGKLIFDITSNRPLTNRVDIINFVTDGMAALPETQGDLVSGDLILNQTTAKFTRLKAYGFFTELALPFRSFGTRINFVLNASENGPRPGGSPDEFSLFLLDENGRPLGSTKRGDWGPIMTVEITGERGGKLNISRQGQRRSRIGEPYQPVNDTPGIAFNVTPGWAPDKPDLSQKVITVEGTLLEFCNRRCDGLIICTGGAFGIIAGETTLYTFDDVSNLKTQVMLVNEGKNPLGEGQLGRARAVGVLQGSTLTVREITFF
jgi:hypothetical protein